MKKKKNKKNSHKRILLKQRAELRRIRRRKLYLNRKNRLVFFRTNKTTRFSIILDEGEVSTVAQLPSNLSINNLEESIKFINEVSSSISKDKSISRIFFDLSNIVQIDYVGICLMLSLANRFLGRGISAKGNYPTDFNARQFIFDSGFCELVSTNVRRTKKNMPDNILYMIGGNSVNNKKIGDSIKETVCRLTGIREHYAPLYENMLEICANSVEHGNVFVQDKNWLVSISFSDNYAKFVLMDTGEGILKTLKRKTRELFADLLSFKSAGNVLNDVFNKKYQSVTGEINRHKGLPNVLSALEHGYISDLEVITNKVYYNFSLNYYTNLKNEFKGTAFLWKVSKENIDKYKYEN